MPLFCCFVLFWLLKQQWRIFTPSPMAGFQSFWNFFLPGCPALYFNSYYCLSHADDLSTWDGFLSVYPPCLLTSNNPCLYSVKFWVFQSHFAHISFFLPSSHWQHLHSEDLEHFRGISLSKPNLGFSSLSWLANTCYVLRVILTAVFPCLQPLMSYLLCSVQVYGDRILNSVIMSSCRDC